ncbi:helix-turn-helix domain-containing protein [Fulvivirgaceae bacterium BMA10]|uniref:Helix-turn-helix domain-containing protein n=1 Tax=Splendidivirga corallicola TaxID=3051826 RepID=A0ABT8KP61_9BACT|nr:helix-turn-helix domain-containing protein [Fulvivirgaceae bacterium BMA10]
MDVFEIYFPKGQLANSVVSIVYYEGYDVSHRMERYIPDGTLSIVIELGGFPQYTYDNVSLKQDKKCVNAWVSGMQSEFITFGCTQISAMMVIQFKPTGAYPILRIPIHELNDSCVDADLIFGDEIKLLRDQIMNARMVASKINIAEKWLMKRLIKTDSIPESVVQFAVEETLLNPSKTNMKVMAEKTGYSQQHFINIFKKYVGFSPKQYQRIVRFNQILKKIEADQVVDWSSLSFNAGFYDQAHFIKEFKKFSGLNPEKYLKEKGEFLNYVPVQV